ncbi:MmcQ/YjbR family DNA-binding protein [Porphyromonas gingivalis]|uniref:MmcQ-like protein n=2 Tax=Porphyromonas gingivalis TaxID=837 RepID=A0A0E2LQK5_PORGN|nr:MmcQ/YjbR family DNA-binding protein [Porphyromonas gingivalis]ATR90241.1 hypothetical protein CS544_03475 [Porphyromonas gingivalis]ERJ66545.1 hypothetical protein HMPREF1555_01058 [Porphyromonas gingivalis F0570]ERJ67368.1 hypothetical protein HMPREF1554_01020 [Porphyromonas gingivalis F0569]ERJ85711.1 hypothetical protein HMPREF1990_02146 [Porphyromonas gingivalis W4087]KXC09182.1 hypothetical protein AT291_03935 [Porphyromonas gingivalis]
MDIEQARELCLSLQQVEESFPFDDVTLVMKVAGKMFALIPLDSEKKVIALKCDPDRSEHLRMHYEGITGAFHMNKRHWNSVALDSDVPADLIARLIRHSYALVVSKLPKYIRTQPPFDGVQEEQLV